MSIWRIMDKFSSFSFRLKRKISPGYELQITSDTRFINSTKTKPTIVNASFLEWPFVAPRQVRAQQKWNCMLRGVSVEHVNKWIMKWSRMRRHTRTTYFCFVLLGVRGWLVGFYQFNGRRLADSSMAERVFFFFLLLLVLLAIDSIPFRIVVYRLVCALVHRPKWFFLFQYLFDSQTPRSSTQKKSLVWTLS